MVRGNGEIDTAAAASLLQWWSDAGVDILVDEAPRDWLRRIDFRSSRAQSPLGLARDERGGSADRLPDQLDLFQAYLRENAALPFASETARRVCPAGDPAAGLMIVTDMPAAEDCEAGTLISGAEGKLFDRMLAAIGRDRGSIYLASLSCLRSPDGRFGTEAAQKCATLARHHIGLAAPRALLLFGDAPAKALLGLGMAQARGRWHEVATHAGAIRTIVTLPPSFLIKQPAAKAYAWADLQMLLEGLSQ